MTECVREWPTDEEGIWADRWDPELQEFVPVPLSDVPGLPADTEGE